MVVPLQCQTPNQKGIFWGDESPMNQPVVYFIRFPLRRNPPQLKGDDTRSMSQPGVYENPVFPLRKSWPFFDVTPKASVSLTPTEC